MALKAVTDAHEILYEVQNYTVVTAHLALALPASVGLGGLP
jgi:hypothetical protein